MKPLDDLEVLGHKEYVQCEKCKGKGRIPTKTERLDLEAMKRDIEKIDALPLDEVQTRYGFLEYWSSGMRRTIREHPELLQDINAAQR